MISHDGFGGRIVRRVYSGSVFRGNPWRHGSGGESAGVDLL